MKMPNKTHFSFLLAMLFLLPLSTFSIPEPSKTEQNKPTELTSASNNTAYDQQYASSVVDLYLKSYNITLEPKKALEPLFKTITETIKYYFGPPIQLPPISEHDIRHCSFIAYPKNQHPTESTINFNLVKKMELVYGAGSKPSDHLALRLSTTTNNQNELSNLVLTKTGKAFLIEAISQPLGQATEIKKRQSIIKACAENNQLHTELTETLKTMPNGENSLLTYYSDKDLINEWFEKIKGGIYWQTPLLTRLNNSANGIQAGIWMGAPFKLMFPLAQLYGMFGPLPASMLHETRFLIRGNSTGLGSLINFLMIVGNKLTNDLTNCIQKRLIDFATYINGAKKLYSLINKNPKIAQNLNTFSELESLIKPSKKHSAEFNELIDLLSTNTFKGNPSQFSLVGRIARAHALISMESVRKEFEGIIRAISELDVYVALAHKISSTKDKEVGYCLVEFDTSSDKPYFKADGLWNPFVNEAHAVTNTIELGGTKPRNIVLSGPNTGGKSTLSKAVLINAILAQTFGIAAAKHMIITPFGNLDCYMNMTDDTASGVSGLKAEVNRAKELIEKLKNTSGFSLILLDEIFTATSPDQAEKLALGFIKSLSEQANSLFVDCAHFEALIQFAEQSKDCRNCHMGAIVNTQGKVTEYTYKLAEGRSTVKNAEQVAEEGNAIW